MKNWLLEYGYPVILLLILLILLVALIVVADYRKTEQTDRINRCQRQGYAAVIRFAGGCYCVRVVDGLLIVVPLESIDTTDAVREPSAHTMVIAR